MCAPGATSGRQRRAEPFGLAALILATAVIHGPAAAGAADAVTGVVVESVGTELERREGANWVPVAQGATVALGERLRTGKGGRAVVAFADIGRFYLERDTEFELGVRRDDFRAALVRGAVWLNALLPEGGHATIATPHAAAGVRGTQFSVFYGDSIKDVCICTCTGRVEGELKSGRRVPIEAGMILAVSADKPEPTTAVSARPILAGADAGYSYCLGCHVKSGQGALKPDWR